MNDELLSQLEALHADAFGWALHCCGGDHPRAEDVLQNAYAKVLENRAAHDGRSLLKTWWFGVIRYTACEEARRARYRDSLLGKLVALVTFDAAHDSRPSPSRQIEIDERSRHLKGLLAMLPARQSEVLHLVFYQDLTLDAAASVMGISPGSARQHYERGKVRLRTLLSDSSPTFLTSHE
ncbi:MAG: sigma-70 family RNA polymerase sigma factor [Verrucomicrobiaceae bacterium]|nr:sigma-70 family RNA polymerase sigma factor [Verrucomicrobiaceae bacterium]